MNDIGILACGPVRDELVATHGEYPAMIARLLQDVDPSVRTTAYRVYLDEFPVDVTAHGAYIISGSRFSVYDPDPWIARLEAFVRALHAARIPTVGICFGHQLISRALGGAADKAPQGWGIGRHVAQVLHRPAWMQPPAAQYGVFVSHQDQVTQLPPGAARLATSAHCPNAMFVLDDVLLGIQGHPEFTGAFAHALAAGRGAVYGEDVLAAALPTYCEPVDSALLARWMLQFIAQSRSTRG
ncbi:MAG: type 1 glutamine amidotransferase [Gammaproteobacteria bacterium]